MGKNIWSIVGGLAAVIALALSIFIFFHGEIGKKRNLEVSLVSRAHLINEDVSGKRKLAVTYNGRSIPNFSLLQIRAENSGRQPIRVEDYSESLSIQISGTEEVVSAEKVASDPSDLSVRPSISDGSITVANLLLNPTDWYILEIGAISLPGKKPDIEKVTARIAGVKSVEYHSSLKRAPKESKADWLTIVVAALSVVVVIIFTWQRLLMNRILDRKAIISSLIKFGESPADKSGPSPSGSAAASPEEQGLSSSIDQAKPANLFWLGNDLMELFDALVRGADRDKIVYMLRQANHHLKSVGLDGSPLQQRLLRLFQEAEKSLNADWTNQRRTDYAQEIRSIVREFGNIVEASQPGFQAHPKQWSD